MLHYGYNSERIIIGEYLTFSNQRARAKRGITAYEVFNENGENVGYVCESWENIPPSKRNADIMFYKHYKLQERCRFTCYGERINWQYLCSRIEREEQVRIYID